MTLAEEIAVCCKCIAEAAAEAERYAKAAKQAKDAGSIHSCSMWAMLAVAAETRASSYRARLSYLEMMERRP